MLMELIKETQLIIVSQCSCLIADRLHLVLKINLSGLPALEYEVWLVGQQVLAENMHLFLVRYLEVLFVFVVFTYEVVEKCILLFFGFFVKSDI